MTDAPEPRPFNEKEVEAFREAIPGALSFAKPGSRDAIEIRRDARWLATLAASEAARSQTEAALREALAKPPVTQWNCPECSEKMRLAEKERDDARAALARALTLLHPHACHVEELSYHGEAMICEACGSQWNNGRKRGDPATPEVHAPECVFSHRALASSSGAEAAAPERGTET